MNASHLLTFLSVIAVAVPACPDFAPAAEPSTPTPGALFGATPSQGWTVGLGGDLYVSADRGGVVPVPAFRLDAVYGAELVDAVFRLSTVAVLNLAEVGGRVRLLNQGQAAPFGAAFQLTMSGLLGIAKNSSDDVRVPRALAVVPTLLMTRGTPTGPALTLGLGLPVRIASSGFTDLDDGTFMLRPEAAVEFAGGVYVRGEVFIPLPLHTGNVIPSLAVGCRL